VSLRSAPTYAGVRIQVVKLKLPKSPGEIAFASYLTERQLTYEHEPFTSGANPDFVVGHPLAGQVILDVYEPKYSLTRNPDGSYHSGFVTSMDKVLRTGVKSKAHQAAVAQQRGLPFVLVFARSNSEMQIDEHVVPGALFGTLKLMFSMGDPPTESPAKIVFGEGGRLQKALNTRFSAAAVITAFNPGLIEVERQIEERTAREKDPLKNLELALNIFKEETQNGRFQDRDNLHRLQIFHNPHAEIPLSPEFGGAHDEQWGNFDSFYGLVASGVHRINVPGIKLL
jgi:hypothetical protein